MQRYEEYAKLLVEVGVNIQKGQNLIIDAPVDCAWFARLCAKAAYAAGCREVIMKWNDDALTREKFLRAEPDVFDTLPKWLAEFMNGYAGEGAAFLRISASDPENMAGVDPDRLTRAQRASGEALKPYREATMSSAIPWCIASIPIPSWAKKVFPGCGEEEAVEKLWEAILQAVRVGGGDAVERWRTHLDTLQRRMDTLNELNLESLHYKNSLGTDAPLRTGVDGVVYAAMPLVHNGVIMDKFHMVVREGKIVEVHAQIGEEALRAAVSVDEGACRFGEVALVPYDSPISSQKLLYYNTLFDENASCHLAFGEAYPECMKGGEVMTKEERQAHGLNTSITHVDFMVGTADLRITGRTRDGRDVDIFIDGNFAF